MEILNAESHHALNVRIQHSTTVTCSHIYSPTIHSSHSVCDFVVTHLILRTLNQPETDILDIRADSPTRQQNAMLIEQLFRTRPASFPHFLALVGRHRVRG